MNACRVLVVDDEKAVLNNIAMYLGDEGFDVTTAMSGEDALELMNKKNFDAGIIDMRLPGMNGNALIQRAHEIQPAMKFFIHTGSTEYIVPSPLKNIGITQDDVFIKPVKDLSLFIRALKKSPGNNFIRDAGA